MDLGTSDGRETLGLAIPKKSTSWNSLFHRSHHSKMSPWAFPSSGKSSRLRVFPFSTTLTFKNNSKAERFSKPSHPKKSEPPAPALPASARRDFQVFLWLHKVGIRGDFSTGVEEKGKIFSASFPPGFFWSFPPFIWGRRIKITPGFGVFFLKYRAGFVGESHKIFVPLFPSLEHFSTLILSRCFSY